MSKEKRQRKIPYTEIAQNIQKSIDQSDVARRDGLIGLRQIRIAKIAGAERERTRLVAKYGDDDVRVTKLARRIDANRTLVAELDREVVRSATEIPSVDGNSWVLHGHVRDTQGRGVPHLVLVLHDENQKPIEKLGSANTNNLGYFKFCYTRNDKDKGDADDVIGIDNDTRSKATAASSGTRVFIHVFDKKVKERLYVDPTPVIPRAGAADYREIVLDENTCPQIPTTPGGSSGVKEKRYLGNSSTRELHDLRNTKSQCQIDEIPPDRQVPFTNQAKAVAAGYDFCAYCFGKSKSKR